MKHADISATLASRMAAMPSAPVVAWESFTFNPQANTPFLAIRQLPASSQPAALGPDALVRAQGIYQITCYTPSGGGSGGIEALADQVMHWFAPQDLPCAGGGAVRLMRAERGPAVDNADWLALPVSVHYWADVSY